MTRKRFVAEVQTRFGVGGKAFENEDDAFVHYYGPPKVVVPQGDYTPETDVAYIDRIDPLGNWLAFPIQEEIVHLAETTFRGNFLGT